MVKCPDCGEDYQQLGNHWSLSESCSHPNLTEKQIETTVGLMMGDGYINNNSKNCSLQIKTITPNYLENLDTLFRCMGRGVKLKRTSKEAAKQNRERGFDANAKEENYSDVYFWSTRSHPKFNEFREWYSSGEKIWPEDIELTPTVLKHWYVGDGNYNNYYSNNQIRIASSNEIENEEKISEYFTHVGLPKPSNFNTYERKSGGNSGYISWNVEDSKELFEYMGEPLPDFEYKWPEEYH
jgi:hypothetical protein